MRSEYTDLSVVISPVRHVRAMASLLLALIFLPACELFTPSNLVMAVIGYETREELSVQAMDEEDPRHRGVPDALIVPDTVARGVPFEVTVLTTSGSGSACQQPAGEEVTTSALTAEIIPYDRWVDGGCADGSILWTRKVPLRFDQSGDATVRLTGRILIEGADQINIGERIGSIEKVVVVK